MSHLPTTPPPLGSGDSSRSHSFAPFIPFTVCISYKNLLLSWKCHKSAMASSK